MAMKLAEDSAVLCWRPYGAVLYIGDGIAAHLGGDRAHIGYEWLDGVSQISLLELDRNEKIERGRSTSLLTRHQNVLNVRLPENTSVDKSPQYSSDTIYAGALVMIEFPARAAFPAYDYGRHNIVPVQRWDPTARYSKPLKTAQNPTAILSAARPSRSSTGTDDDQHGNG